MASGELGVGVGSRRPLGARVLRPAPNEHEPCKTGACLQVRRHARQSAVDPGGSGGARCPPEAAGMGGTWVAWKRWRLLLGKRDHDLVDDGHGEFEGVRLGGDDALERQRGGVVGGDVGEQGEASFEEDRVPVEGPL